MFGALRYKNPIPWDNDVDIGLLAEDFDGKNEIEIVAAFKEKNINIKYSMWFGTYRVTRGAARGDLMVFRRTYFNQRCRIGIEPWVFYLNHQRYHTIPASLLELPLPTLPFAGVDLSIPRHGIEVQKYMYPHDWWKEIKPTGCD